MKMIGKLLNILQLRDQNVNNHWWFSYPKDTEEIRGTIRQNNRLEMAS